VLLVAGVAFAAGAAGAAAFGWVLVSFLFAICCYILFCFPYGSKNDGWMSCPFHDKVQREREGTGTGNQLLTLEELI
jgi:hypothetical protein